MVLIVNPGKATSHVSTLVLVMTRSSRGPPILKDTTGMSTQMLIKERSFFATTHDV